VDKVDGMVDRVGRFDSKHARLSYSASCLLNSLQNPDFCIRSSPDSRLQTPVSNVTTVKYTVESRGRKHRTQHSGYRGVIVAFSGGVDSSYLAFMAHRILRDAAKAVTGLSPSVSQQQKELVDSFVERFGLNHEYVETREMEDPGYTTNPSDRCYYCKSELFAVMEKLRVEGGFEAVFDGSNADDLGDYRPGRRAAEEGRVVSPLIEAGMTKEEIRERSRFWKLPTWDLPAMPCLSSRLPYGVEVTPEKLRQVEKAEEFIRSLGFREFRVRHHENLARIEVSTREMPAMLEPDLFERVNRALKELGYTYVTLDLEGFRSGALNELLQLETG